MAAIVAMIGMNVEIGTGFAVDAPPTPLDAGHKKYATDTIDALVFPATSMETVLAEALFVLILTWIPRRSPGKNVV